MTVAEATQLRRQCQSAGVNYRVVKNRLARRALDDLGMLPPDEVLQGPTAVAIASDEVTAPARVLAEFAKDSEHLVLKGGFLGERWLEAAGVEQLAKIPPREQLLTRLAGDLRSPLNRLAWALKAPLAKMGMALKALAQQKAG
jgi:large subunit ribosomal protein L10